MNSNSTIDFFKKIEKRNPNLNKITIIGDRASYYTSKKVTKYLESSKIFFMPLPPYCPNLNLIERLWKILKKNIHYNIYYDSYEEFQSASINFLNRTSMRHKQILKSALAENFEILSPI